jgi:hypothetical protein
MGVRGRIERLERLVGDEPCPDPDHGHIHEQELSAGDEETESPVPTCPTCGHRPAVSAIITVRAFPRGAAPYHRPAPPPARTEPDERPVFDAPVDGDPPNVAITGQEPVPPVAETPWWEIRR